MPRKLITPFQLFSDAPSPVRGRRCQDFRHLGGLAWPGRVCDNGTAMKAIVIHRFGAPDVLSYEDVPDPVAGPGEVVVEVHAVDDVVNSGDGVSLRRSCTI